MGQPRSRQPRSGSKAKPPSNKAQRQLAMMQQQAKAASTKGLALSVLAMEFSQKIADAHRTHQGPALEAALSTLSREQRAAKQALVTKLDGDAAAERKAIAQHFCTEQGTASCYQTAANENTRRIAAQPGRPRDRSCGTRAPRLHR